MRCDRPTRWRYAHVRQDRTRNRHRHRHDIERTCCAQEVRHQPRERRNLRILDAPVLNQRVPVRGDQQITITSFVREFRGPDAVIECTMADDGGKTLSRCLMTVAHVDRTSNRATDWPPEVAALFFENA